MKEKILVTGCAGFIGMHLCKKLFELGYEVFGIDNLNSYYDVNLKLERLSILKKYSSFTSPAVCWFGYTVQRKTWML